MIPVVILGAEGHGRKVADILHDIARTGRELRQLRFMDSNLELRGSTLLGIAVLGDWAALEVLDITQTRVIYAVGNPKRCKSLSERAGAMGFEFARVVSPRALVSPYAQVPTAARRASDPSYIGIDANVIHNIHVETDDTVGGEPP